MARTLKELHVLQVKMKRTAICKIDRNFFSKADLYQFTGGTPSERFPFILKVAVCWRSYTFHKSNQNVCWRNFTFDMSKWKVCWRSHTFRMSKWNTSLWMRIDTYTHTYTHMHTTTHITIAHTHRTYFPHNRPANTSNQALKLCKTAFLVGRRSFTAFILCFTRCQCFKTENTISLVRKFTKVPCHVMKCKDPSCRNIQSICFSAL